MKRTGDKNDGCATMWKKDKFRLLRSTPVTYCRGGLLDRDNIAVIAELQPVRSGHDHNVSEVLWAAHSVKTAGTVVASSSSSPSSV